MVEVEKGWRYVQKTIVSREHTSYRGWFTLITHRLGLANARGHQCSSALNGVSEKQ